MRNIHKQINTEISQGAETRRQLFKRAQKEFGNRTLVAFFTSFNHPVDITDSDCDMVQSVLQNIDVSNGLILMISSPGGDGLAAERIVNTCRAYSGTGDYWAMVPGKAKSAGTIITMGASKILMGPSSELGPVDPQIFRVEDGVRKVFSAHNLVAGYERLFAEATATTGPVEPYLQQLAYYDDREVNLYKSLISLSENIAIKMLRSGMMQGVSEDEVKKKIEMFLNPEAGTLSHGRPIYSGEAKDCGLSVEEIDITSKKWELVYELYARIELYVSYQACKAVESAEESFYVSP